jgi:hypothetical protein
VTLAAASSPYDLLAVAAVVLALTLALHLIVAKTRQYDDVAA